ncbi:MAG: VOC family protein [Phycisphaeraceae bacterium]
MITGIAHLCFFVRDLDAMEAFYCETLGLERAFDFTDDAGHRTGMYVHVGGRTFIELFEKPHEDRSATQAYQHVCLEVDDLAKTVEALQAAGVETSEPKLGDDESWQAWITDPEGNAIELHQYTPKSWQAPFAGREAQQA